MNAFNELASDWPGLSVLLDEALSLPASERAAWLASLSGERARFSTSLRRLMDAGERADGGAFLQELPALRGLDEMAGPGEPEADAKVGPYRLISELGRGGMGTVWLAERVDGQPRRRVALKMPRVAWGGFLAERLLRERDILASLEHPHIARLYDAGMDAFGRPYLAMEFVEGLPIDQYVRTHALPMRERLGLVLQVCDAVAHAHARLVVHRDLKPGNVLVTAEGQVRLLDFGIAKLIEDDFAAETALTRASGRALSLDHASPEQIRGEPLGTASDIYSLGVLSYELLAGTRPYRLKRGSAAELEEAIAHVDPPRPSDQAEVALTRKQLRGDLDAILAIALKKNPAQRYATVEALADDIRRHLRGLPVLARPESQLYRAGRFVARHRIWVGALATAFLALTVGLGMALWQTGVALHNEQVARQAAEREAAVKLLLVETLSVAVTADPAKLREPDGFGQLLYAKFEEFEQRFKDQPGQWLDLLEVVSTRLPAYGDYECSLIVGQRYLALLKKTKADDARVLRAYLSNARAFSKLQRSDKAAVLLREALELVPDTPATHGERVAVATELGLASTALDRQGEVPKILAVSAGRGDGTLGK
jgi:serine/threonine-protein kinase